ncbi:MAG TPA: polysaccharide deacetylase family protein [Solirubrobacteraceae bacterium]|nr:polysaccharide deacetylase family protein [Solirubrobacteraceae bacterium]
MGSGIDDGAPAARRAAHGPDGRRPPPGSGRRVVTALHRRRRTTAGAGALALLVIVIVAIGVGGGGVATKVARGPAPLGLFTRIRLLAGDGTTSFAAEESRALSRAIDRTLAYTPYVRVAGAQHRELALTFDDGPGPYTPDVLAILQRDHVPGTFFEVGVEEQYFHASTTQIVRDGLPIGDHTEDHRPMSQLSRADQKSQLLRDAAAIGAYGAPFPRLFRPPDGVWNATTLSLLARYRMLMVLWTVDTNDYQLPGVSAIVDSAVDGARPGAIILLHDAGGNRAETVAALPIIIRDLHRRGYKLVTVPQLLLDNPAPHDQDIVGLTGLGGA